MQRYLLLFLFFATSVFAVVEIAPNEVGLRPGIAGEIGGSVTNKRGNTDKNEYFAHALLSYDNNRTYVTWVDASYAYAEANGIENEDNAFIHFRFVHTFYHPDWNIEFFAQDQEDDFKQIAQRLLGGAGMRWRMLSSDTYGRAYLGLGAYAEHIRYTTDIDPDEHNGRINSYAAYTKKFGKDARISYTGYYQPKTDSTEDYYLTQSLALKINIFLRLYLQVQIDYDYDSRPATGVEKEDFSQQTSLIWQFGAKAKR
jgi:hypothetical protein